MGLIGAALATGLRSRGYRVCAFSRRSSPGVTHEIDIGTSDGQSLLARALQEEQCDVVVLAHGPADADWFEGNEQAAAFVHVGTARTAATNAPRVVLLSTDGVFGAHQAERPGGWTVADSPRPTNAYGRVKHRAEVAVLDHPRASVVRISVVYGWSGRGQHWNYGEHCLRTLAAGHELRAPVDQSFTPVYLPDAVSALGQVISAGRTGIWHLSGPQHLSRYEFALIAAHALGRPRHCVVPVPKGDTRWASRPDSSALSSSPWRDDGEWAVKAIGPEQGLRAMTRSAASPVVPAC